MTHSSIDKTAEFQRMRARLTSIVARMLASRAEAEDVVQEVWLKWQAADAAALHTPPAWLTTVATRLALDRLRRLAAERAARESEWIAEPWRDEFAPSAEEAALKA
ncbi:MAG: sigma factor [Trinickia sp.]|uniref:sigma factor n=1 Tax=Trinickia sp. TaxID=2571163 RepID=UPI003F80A774